MTDNNMTENETTDQDRRPSDIEGQLSGSDIEGSDHEETGRKAGSEESSEDPQTGFDSPPWRPSDEHEKEVLDESSHSDTNSAA